MKNYRVVPVIIITAVLTTMVFNHILYLSNVDSFYGDTMDYTNLTLQVKSTYPTVTVTIPENKTPLEETQCFADPVQDQYNAVGLSSNQTYDHIKEMCSKYTDADFDGCKVPNVVHLIPGRGFKFHHYLNIRAIKKVLNPDRIYIHGEVFPFDNRFFMQAVSEFDLDLVVSRNFQTIFNGIPVRNGEHKADVLRMEALLKYGGIYLDMDAYPIKSFERFLKDEFSIGYQNQEQNYGLNNGIMISKKCSRFLLNWYEQYAYFNPDQWDTHSVQLPLKLYEENPTQVRAYRHELLSWWCFDGKVETLPMFKPYNGNNWKNVYAVHSFYRVYAGTTPFPINFETIKTLDNSFGRFARYVLYGGPPM
ncbi:hypothetical protein HDV06_004218 [Boothiomyces sp. JEL0866]|nr:hypothetical protein HDV06_004218 [Boothiomyces sp. JEL0866]